MKYLLDTDHISLLQRQSGAAYSTLLLRISRLPVTDFALSIVSFHEQVIGAHDFINRAKSPKDLRRGYVMLGEVLDGFSAATVLPFDEAAIALFDELRAQRIRISTMDLRIATIALSRGLVLLTRNVRDFERVPNLDIQDWTV
jgi:tRNA(fMet)-specific endonuclease VapC